MFLHSSRRLFFNLIRPTIFKSNHLERCTTVPVRHLSFHEQTKRKILLKINTVLNENENLDGNSDPSEASTVACLNNELILSERSVKFPFNYRCVLEQQLAVCQDREVSDDQWKELYELIGDTVKPIFASITMLVCVQMKHVERGRSLFQFIQRCHPELFTSTPTAYAAYMHLLASDFFSIPGKKHLEEYSPYEKELCDVYEKFVKSKKQSAMASPVALGIIKGLCVTRLWREAYSYLPWVSDDDQLQAMTDLILAALHNDDLQFAMKLIQTLQTAPPNDNTAATMSTSLTHIVREMFRNLNDKTPESFTFIEKSAVDEMQSFFTRFHVGAFKFGTTFVFPSGVCKELPDLKLVNEELTNDEFNFLRTYLTESAYTAKEVYNTTTPAEFNRFQALLQRRKFTMIVDGLNILYGVDRFATDPEASMIKTISLLKNLRVSRSDMLFIARKHALSRIPTNIQNDLRALCEVFLVDNTSRDDWFVLYAALHSKAYVLTSDILRKERGITSKTTPAKNTQVNETLQKWLYRYQYMFIRQGGGVYFKQPMAYKLRAQCTQNVWLIPSFTKKPVSLAQRPDSWFYVYRSAERQQPFSPRKKRLNDEK